MVGRSGLPRVVRARSPCRGLLRHTRTTIPTIIILEARRVIYVQRNNVLYRHPKQIQDKTETRGPNHDTEPKPYRCEQARPRNERR